MTIYELVKQLLTLKPVLRDDDKKLIWSVWAHQGKIVGGKISVDDYLTSEIEESVTRARRMVQNDFPELKASPIIEEARKAKKEDKGSFIFREKVDTSEPLTMSHEARIKLHNMFKEELIKKGVIKPKNTAKLSQISSSFYKTIDAYGYGGIGRRL